MGKILVKYSDKDKEKIKELLREYGCGYSEIETMDVIVEKFRKKGSLVKGYSDCVVIYNELEKKYLISKDAIQQMGTLYFSECHAREFAEELNKSLQCYGK